MPVIFILARIGRSVGVVVRLSLIGGTQPLFREICPYEHPRGFRGQKNNIGRLLECVPEWGLTRCIVARSNVVKTES